MKKKCGFIALVGMLSIFLASCLSTGFGNTLLTKENAGTLASKNFKLNYIYLVSDFSLTDKDAAVKIIENLPFEQVASDLSDNYELTLDTSLFSKDALSSEVTQPVSDKGASLRGWVWKNESEEAALRMLNQGSSIIEAQAKSGLSYESFRNLMERANKYEREVLCIRKNRSDTHK